MNDALARHPDSELLLRLADEDLSGAGALELQQHLAGCEDCRRQFQLLQGALAQYLRFHDEVLKPSLPPPPGEWRSPIPAVAPPPAEKHVWIAVWPWLRWAGAAAIVLTAVILLVRRLGQTPPVDAAELLRKASVAEQQAPRGTRRIRVRTRGYTWDRPAQLSEASTGEAAHIKSLFDEAGYGWEDPLSPRTFSMWREALPDKHDEVTAAVESGSVVSYVIRTSAGSGALSDASLTLAADLHATACGLRFRSGETIELTELPAGQAIEQPAGHPAAPPAPAVDATPATQHEAAEATPSSELRVIAALHGAGADLGEPIAVTRQSNQVLVRAAGLTPARQQELRVALAGIPGVQLEFAEVREPGHEALAPRRGNAHVEPANPLVAELQTHLGSDATGADLADRLMEDTDRAIERAYALRSLARRFPGDAADGWTSAERAILGGLVSDHLNHLADSLAAIRSLVAPVLPAGETPPESVVQTVDWRRAAELLPAPLQQLDRLLNAGSDDPAGILARKAQLAQTLAGIQRQVAALRNPQPQ